MNKSESIGRRTFLFSLAGLSTSAHLPKASAETRAFAPFSFAFVTDCHLAHGIPDGVRLTQESQLFLQDAVKQINSLAVDFVVFGGDQVDRLDEDEANWQLFVDIVQSLNCPWFFVLGEADVSGTGHVDKVRTYGRDWKGKGLAGDRPYWSHDVLAGIHLIGLDTSCPNSTGGELSGRQLIWLQEDLSNHKGKFTIVVSHHPLLPPRPYDGGPPWNNYTVPEAAAAREILNASSDIRLAISGHLPVSSIAKDKDIWYVCCPSLDTFPCAFKLFRVTPDNVAVQTYQIGYPALIKKAHDNLLASSIAHQYDNAKPGLFLNLAQGSHADQNACLPLSNSQAQGSIKTIKTARTKTKRAPRKTDQTNIGSNPN